MIAYDAIPDGTIPRLIHVARAGTMRTLCNTDVRIRRPFTEWGNTAQRVQCKTCAQRIKENSL